MKLSTHSALIRIQRLRTADDFLDDKRVTFLWPKMHSITHLLASIRGKGVTANTSTDSGEALHPQTRTFWQRCNHQPDTAEDQVCRSSLLVVPVLTFFFEMLQMAYEKEVVLSIRHHIEVYEQEQAFNTNIPDNSNDMVARFDGSHIHLGSRQRGLRVPSYGQVLEAELGFREFGDSLARFIRDYTRVQVYGSEFKGDGFIGHQLCINWLKVCSFLSRLITSEDLNLTSGFPSLFVQGFIRLPRNSGPEDGNIPCFTKLAQLGTATRFRCYPGFSTIQRDVC